LPAAPARLSARSRLNFPLDVLARIALLLGAGECVERVLNVAVACAEQLGGHCVGISAKHFTATPVDWGEGGVIRIRAVRGGSTH
jgi:hypothetical protein